MTGITDLTLTELADRISSGDLSARDATMAALDRAHALNGA